MPKNAHYNFVLDKQDAVIIQQSFASYERKAPEMSDEEWLTQFLRKELSDTNQESAKADAKDIIETVALFSAKRKSLRMTRKTGESRCSWLQKELQKSAENISEADFVNYLSNIDDTIATCNTEMADTVLRLDGQINQNPRLDGFIAEQDHVNTFNMDAAIKSKHNLNAEVLKPTPGKTFGKNSVDIQIRKDGRVVARYQSKYGKNSQRTADLFEHGNYRGQQKLIPDGQNIPAKNTGKLSKDGVQSTPLSKFDAEEMRDSVQRNETRLEKTWSDYNTKQLVLGIGKQAATAGICAAGLGSIGYAGYKWFNGEAVEGKEIALVALKAGGSAGATTALAGGVKVLLEKKPLSILGRPPLPWQSPYPPLPLPIPPGPIPTLPKNIVPVAIASLVVSQANTLLRLGSGEIGVLEAVDELEEGAFATVGGIAGATKGAATGAALGAVFGPVGSTIGSFVGGVVGSIAGSSAGKAIAAGYKKARRTVQSCAQKVCECVEKGVTCLINTFNSLFS